MIHKIFLTFLLSVCMTGCNIQAKQNPFVSADPVVVHRFDKDLYHLIETGDSTLFPVFVQKYPVMTEILGRAILNMKTPDSPGFFEKMLTFYSEPTLNQLYKDALTRFEEVGEIEQQLGSGLAYLCSVLPVLPVPEVYMHVSGFNQNVVVGEKTLSLSIDKYLGFDYPLYQDFFYDHQRVKMQPSYIVQDYLTGWLMSEYPFAGKENVLLDRMVYEGKIKYLVGQALAQEDPAHLLAYSEEDLTWVKQHEGSIWKAMIERKHLYTPDHITTSQYFDTMPSHFLADNAPGNLGTYIGLQLVSRYMEETKATPEQLMQQQNAQEILSAAKYKP